MYLETAYILPGSLCNPLHLREGCSSVSAFHFCAAMVLAADFAWQAFCCGALLGRPSSVTSAIIKPAVFVAKLHKPPELSKLKST